MSPSPNVALDHLAADIIGYPSYVDPYDAIRVALAAGELDYHNAIELELMDRPTPSAATLRRLREAGVPQDILGCPIVSLREANVQLLPAGRFDFTEDDVSGDVAVLVAVRNLREEVIDIAAWLLAKPASVFLLEGRAACLGEHLIRNPASSFAAPLPVFQDALSWLRAGATGIVILDQRNAWRRFFDRDISLLAEDRSHSRMLARALTPPRLTPRIFVRRAA